MKSLNASWYLAYSVDGNLNHLIANLSTRLHMWEQILDYLENPGTQKLAYTRFILANLCQISHFVELLYRNISRRHRTAYKWIIFWKLVRISGFNCMLFAFPLFPESVYTIETWSSTQQMFTFCWSSSKTNRKLERSKAIIIKTE